MKKIGIVSLIIIIFDRIFKVLVTNNLTLNVRNKVIDGFFYITNCHNDGAAFSLFSGNVLFLILITFMVLYLIYKTIEKNNINRKYDGYISFKNKKWLIKHGDYNEILNQNLVLMISNKETLESEYGNIILAGHNNKYVFSNLYKLNIGDEIIVGDFNYEYLFKVYDISKVNIKNKSILDNVYDNKILTLITCTSNNQIRYVVTAKYIHTISHN